MKQRLKSLKIHLLSRLKKIYLRISKSSFNEFFLVIFPNLLFTIFGYGIIIYSFKNVDIDTTNLTNYGFAILAGISSICFSWSKNLNSEDENTSERIIIIAECFLHTAIIFLLSSAIKYSAIHIDLLIPKEWNILYKICYYILAFSNSMCITFGFFKMNSSVTDLNKLLFERLYKVSNE